MHKRITGQKFLTW